MVTFTLLFLIKIESITYQSSVSRCLKEVDNFRYHHIEEFLQPVNYLSLLENRCHLSKFTFPGSLLRLFRISQTPIYLAPKSRKLIINNRFQPTFTSNVTAGFLSLHLAWFTFVARVIPRVNVQQQCCTTDYQLVTMCQHMVCTGFLALI